ncbi:MAG: serine protease [Ruminococcaceae bacterium]|nr:serine protease [Oscillospiraceae bacterium]
MKISRILTRALSLVAACSMSLGMVGCLKKDDDGKINAKNLMDGITPRDVSELSDITPHNTGAADFALRLFKASAREGENTLISPLSVLYALSMTANGAEKETLAEMESVLGMRTGELNEYLYSYMKNLPQGEKYKLSVANSIWFRDDDRFTVNGDFLQTNADYYKADIYKAPFDDSTLKDVNNWVNGKTDGMIPEILDQISDQSIMLLVNALAFDAEWIDPYTKDQVRDGKFTKEDGTKQDASFMYGYEDSYIQDENAIGFVKYYSGAKYAFVALLPNEGVSVSDYVSTLDGEKVLRLLSSQKGADVSTAIPKFEIEYDVEMSKILQNMGMKEAFDGDKADFGKLGSSEAGNIYISRVIHKTFISVGEKGTRAGAATVVDMVESCMPMPQERKVVILDRPFVYMLVDCENNLPFFIGTMMDVGN